MHIPTTISYHRIIYDVYINTLTHKRGAFREYNLFLGHFPTDFDEFFFQCKLIHNMKMFMSEF